MGWYKDKDLTIPVYPSKASQVGDYTSIEGGKNQKTTIFAKWDVERKTEDVSSAPVISNNDNKLVENKEDNRLIIIIIISVLVIAGIVNIMIINKKKVATM